MLHVGALPATLTIAYPAHGHCSLCSSCRPEASTYCPLLAPATANLTATGPSLRTHTNPTLATIPSMQHPHSAVVPMPPSSAMRRPRTPSGTCRHAAQTPPFYFRLIHAARTRQPIEPCFSNNAITENIRIQCNLPAGSTEYAVTSSNMTLSDTLALGIYKPPYSITTAAHHPCTLANPRRCSLASNQICRYHPQKPVGASAATFCLGYPTGVPPRNACYGLQGRLSSRSPIEFVASTVATGICREALLIFSPHSSILQGHLLNRISCFKGLRLTAQCGICGNSRRPLWSFVT